MAPSPTRLKYIHPSPPTPVYPFASLHYPGIPLRLLLPTPASVYTSFSTYPRYSPPSPPTSCIHLLLHLPQVYTSFSTYPLFTLYLFLLRYTPLSSPPVSCIPPPPVHSDYGMPATYLNLILFLT